MHTTYGQFCPVALGAEIIAERWTPLIVRELLNGSHRFCDLQRGLPGISRNLLTQRLGQLTRAGVIERRGSDHAAGYRLTEAGTALAPVIDALGEWGYRWAAQDLRREHLDPALLMWFFRRRVRVPRLPQRRVVVCFEFRDVRRLFWLVLHRPDVDLCVKDEGFDADLTVVTKVETLAHVYLGHLPLARAIRCGQVELIGPSALQRGLHEWLGISPFANVALAS